MAGITLHTLTRELGHCNVVRSIPNTPSQVGEGLYYAPTQARPELTAAAQQVFGAIGLVIRVEDEAQIDSGTALAGGGPALVAFFADALQECAHEEGFDARQAELIATQLLHGTARLIRETGKPAWQVCKDVQTKGGTTECAIDTFVDADIKGIVKAALRAAARRSVELGK
jgi:pyrroline-5-carboxylate reductase